MLGCIGLAVPFYGGSDELSGHRNQPPDLGLFHDSDVVRRTAFFLMEIFGESAYVCIALIDLPERSNVCAYLSSNRRRLNRVP